MTLSVHIDGDMVRELDRVAKETGQQRSSIIRRAIKEWFEQRNRKVWPESIREFKGIKSFPTADELRSDLK